MSRHLALAAMIVTMALMISACATTGDGRDYDETLLDCQAEADASGKARYTPQWQSIVDQCVQEAEKQ